MKPLLLSRPRFSRTGRFESLLDATDDTQRAALEGDAGLWARGNLQRDLLRLGLLPCAVLTLALTGWFTYHRLAGLESAFVAESQAMAQHVAVMSDLSLFAGDLPALQSVARAALHRNQAERIEISNGAGIFVAVGASPASSALRIFSAPVTLRDASEAAAFAPAGSVARENVPIGIVQAFRDTSAYSKERLNSLLAGMGVGSLALLAAWLAVDRMARKVTRPLRRISQTVAALQADQFEARCQIETHAAMSPASQPDAHEFVSLAQDINHLAQRLQRNHQASENRVREATAVALLRMAEAEQAALSRARFLAATSHDLRQPLHAMGLFIEGLLPVVDEAQRPLVLRLQESTHFMGVLLDDLLDISRLDARVLSPSVSDVPLAPLFDALATQYSAQASVTQVRLIWHDHGLAVRSDATLLQRALGHLVSNAIRHAPWAGTVMVVARRRAQGVRIEVRDNGVGIASIHHRRVFEEFYQVGNTERDCRRGFGLGLTICARIAALLGTRIELRSALARGSLFSLHQPIASSPALR